MWLWCSDVMFTCWQAAVWARRCRCRSGWGSPRRRRGGGSSSPCPGSGSSSGTRSCPHSSCPGTAPCCWSQCTPPARQMSIISYYCNSQQYVTHQVCLLHGAWGIMEYIAWGLTLGQLDHQHQHQCWDHCLCNLIIFLKMSLTILLLFRIDTSTVDKIASIILSSHVINWYIYIFLFEINKANIDINMTGHFKQDIG